MPSFRELLAATKSQIREVDTATADELRRQPGAVVLDVREPDEYEQGAIPGAVHIPRGTLEGSVENRIADKSAPVIIHCASGVRSAFAAKTLTDMGYEDVVSVVGGFNKWKDEGRDWAAPRKLTPEQRNRYQRHLLLPEVDVEGQLKLLDAKVLLLGAGGLGSPAALYLAAAGVGTIGIVDMDVVDESNLQRQILHNVDRIGERKVDSAKKTLTAINPDVNVVTHDVRLGADNVVDILSGYDLVVDSLGGENLLKWLTVLKPGGLAIGVSGPPDAGFAKQLGAPKPFEFVLSFLSRKVRKAAKKLGVRYSFFFMHASGAQLRELAALYDAGHLRPVIDSTFTFDQTLQALAYVENGKAKAGKVVVAFD